MSESLSTSWYVLNYSLLFQILPNFKPPQANRRVQSAERPRGHLPRDLHRGLLNRVLQDQSRIRQTGVMTFCYIVLGLGIWIWA